MANHEKVIAALLLPHHILHGTTEIGVVQPKLQRAKEAENRLQV